VDKTLEKGSIIIAAGETYGKKTSTELNPKRGSILLFL
jgi:hypothetical protein